MNNQQELGMSDAIADMRQGFFFHLNKIKMAISDCSVQGMEGNPAMLMRWCLMLIEARRVLAGWLSKDTIKECEKLWEVKEEIRKATSMLNSKSYDQAVSASTKEAGAKMLSTAERKLDEIQISLYDQAKQNKLTAPFDDEDDPFEIWKMEAGADPIKKEVDDGETESDDSEDSGSDEVNN